MLLMQTELILQALQMFWNLVVQTNQTNEI